MNPSPGSTTASLSDRGRAAFLGLALGDAYGAPLEFLSSGSVRTHPVRIEAGHFRWTDDTHMALYLAEATLAHGPGPVDADRFGLAVGAAFSAWLDDPLTGTTAPGSTCIAGATRWRETRDWRTSGAARPGCGAVMRICPLALAHAGDDLTVAAEVSARVTHAHPDAVEAAIAASHLLAWTLEEARFDGDLVRRAIAQLEGPWSRGESGRVARALEAALEEGARAGEWLDEGAIPDQQRGGWLAPGALGLAVAAALRWRGDIARAIEGGARIDGDSDSVACLAGMYLGAAAGVDALPAAWLEVLPERARIVALADRLLALRAAPGAPGGGARA
jgi:ADP-ribosylglycohydrolase